MLKKKSHSTLVLEYKSVGFFLIHVFYIPNIQFNLFHSYKLYTHQLKVDTDKFISLNLLVKNFHNSGTAQILTLSSFSSILPPSVGNVFCSVPKTALGYKNQSACDEARR